MIVAGEVISRQHDVNAPVPPFYVNVMRAGMGHSWRRPLRKPEFKDAVTQWCERNCSGDFHVGKARSVHFALEGDAILFWLTHKETR